MSEEELLGESRQRLSRRWPFALAHLDVGRTVRAAFLSALAILVILSAVAPLTAELVVLPTLGLLILVPAIFRLVAAMTRHETAASLAAPALDDADLPVYSVLIPLCDEAHMVQQLVRAMTAIRYPPEKLDIKFVVEARSESTIDAVEAVLADPRFELIVVPDAEPRTKPKACNYALPFVRGKYLVIYDAEDVPDPDQLRLAASVFAAEPNVDCLQAELMIDNARENFLTGLFAGEYAGQFGVMMPTLVRWGLPVPLGGTSNHFSIEALREVGGWDAFNVTEDADLGVRLARLRYRAEMLGSRTCEEAPIEIGAWMQQRTRWMKGWMQTFIVHNRRPASLLKDLGWRGFMGFEIYLGSVLLAPLLHTVFLASIVLRLAILGTPPFTPFTPLTGLELIVMIVGYGAAFAVAIAGLKRLGQQRLLWLQALLPLYWVLHSIATIRAGHELMTRPHYWAKTTHRAGREHRGTEATAAPQVGNADYVVEDAGG
jgi:cellulose synthase/poly-beta-1,6-N-acetylglucosamine synthase-like glycosyltransferase